MHWLDAIRRERPYPELSGFHAHLISETFQRGLRGGDPLGLDALAHLVGCTGDDVSKAISPHELLAVASQTQGIRLHLLGLVHLESDEAIALMEDLHKVLLALYELYTPGRETLPVREVFDKAEVDPKRIEQLRPYLEDANLRPGSGSDLGAFHIHPSHLARGGLPQVVAKLAAKVGERHDDVSPSWLDPPGPFELRWTGFDVEGFRALRDLRLRLPSRLTVLVGVNGAGKSTALDVGAFVAHALRLGLPSALDAENGVARMRSRGSTAPISVRLHFDVDLGTGQRPAEYGFVIDERYGTVQVEREELITRADETPVTWLDRKRAIAHVPLSDDHLRHTVYPRLDDLYLGSMSDPADYPIASGILNDLCRALLIDRDPVFSAPKPEPMFNAGDHGGDPVRTRWAATTAELLHQAIPDDKAAARLGGVLADLLPAVREVRRIGVTGGHARFEIVEADSPEPATFDELSAGMRQMLLLAAVYIHPRPPALLLLEEPDAGIHVGAFHPMRDLLRSISRRSVVLATSHSPVFVGLLDPEHEVVVLDRDERGVHARSLDQARRSRKWLAAFEHPAEAFVRLGMERKR